MKVITPSIQFIHELDGPKIIKELEMAARTCYQSASKGDPRKLVSNIIKNGHTSVLEHIQIPFVVITDRGVLAEWTRHRIASYSVESTRYVKYNDVEFILPIECTDETKMSLNDWTYACQYSEEIYGKMIQAGAKPQEARSVLNNSLKTTMRVSMNLRSLRNFLTLRCAPGAHPHIKQLTIPMLLYLQKKIPIVFDDIEYDQVFYATYLSDNRWMTYINPKPQEEEWNDYRSYFVEEEKHD